MPWLALVIASLAAVLFAALGFLLGKRPVADEMRPAWNLFRAWWFGVAIITALKPLRVGLYFVDALPVWLYLSLRQLEFIAICVALWALLCYLIYAYRGSRRSWWHVGFGYGLLAFILLAILAAAGEPQRLVLENAEVVAEPGIDLEPTVTLAVLVLLVGPQIFAAIAYARLYGHVQHPTQRFRVALVSAAIIGWFGIRLAGAAADAQGPAWHVATACLGLAAALLVLLAYYPPPALRQKWGIQPVGAET